MDFNSTPYYDDFEASNGAKDQNYMRILFRPGNAVQARELTQIQSIIQNQLKKFGDHIFQDGSPVYGGQITLDNNVQYLKLQTTYNNVDIDLEDFAGKVIFNAFGSSKIRAKVAAFDETQTQPTLVIRYLRGTQFPDGNVIATGGGSYAQLVPTNASGTGSVASISDGVFYVNGFFVQVAAQTIVLDPYSSTPTYKVGLEIDDNIIDFSADANLLDPAQESFNYQAPGADRYQFKLNLAKRTLDSVDDAKFFELLRVEKGLITKQVEYPIYSEIEKTFARRTYDESGDYTVKPFGISLTANDSNDSVFVVNIEPGKAYVKGFEYETIGTQKIEVSKARTTNTSTDYDVSLDYGNYLIVNNVLGSANGFPNIASLDILDLHCVPKANINIAGPVGYNTSLIGTARLRNIDKFSASETILYLTDLRLSSNNVVPSANATNANSIVLPSIYSDLNDAYANVMVRWVAGAGSVGETRTIVRYDGSTRTAIVDRNFTLPANTGNTFSILFGITDTDSLAETVSTKAAYNVAMDVSSTSRNSANGTILGATDKDSLIFMLPEEYVANGSITNADFYHKKFLETKSFSSGVCDVTLSGNETFPYGSDGQNLDDMVANNNILVMVKSSGSSGGFSVGQYITFGGANYVQRISNQLLKINSGGNFTADIYVTVKVNDSEQATNNRRTKTIKGNSAITTLRATDSPTNATAVVGAANVKIDSTNGFVWFTNTANTNKSPGSNNSLYIADVFKIVKVYDSGNPSFAPNSTNAIDITTRFYLDSGQNLGYYDHSKLVLKPSSSAPKGQTVVMLQYYDHGSSISGYFDVDSYPATQYANGTIPIFIDTDGNKYNLRDAIDFRPTRDIGTSSNVNSYTFIGMKTPVPTQPIELTYSYYVPRIDKVILTKDRELKVIQGTAGKYPLEPKDSDNGMTLFKLNIPAYTTNPTDVDVTKVENKRYTMRDIGNLETRIKNIEYYTALSIAEKKATDTTILYEDGATVKEKYGIVADNFTGFNVVDSASPDLKCSIQQGSLGPYGIMRYIHMNLNTAGAGTQKNDKTVSLSYFEEVAIEQGTATGNVTVQPYLYGTFEGHMSLSPQSDAWISTQLEPASISPQVTIPQTISTPVVGQQQPVVDQSVLESGVDGFAYWNLFDQGW